MTISAGDAGCCQHAPDEHILWPLMREGMELIAGLYWDLGDPATGVPGRHDGGQKRGQA